MIIFVSLINFILKLSVWWILSVFVLALPNKVNKLVKFAEDKALVRDNASKVLEENQRYYNHSFPRLSNDFIRAEDTSELVFCECLNVDQGGGLPSLGQGANRDLHLIRPFLFWVANSCFCQKTRSKPSRGDYYIGFISHFPATALSW